MKIQDRIKAAHATADQQVPKVQASFLSVVEEVRTNLFDSKVVEEYLSDSNVDGVLNGTGINNMDDLLFGVGMDNTAYVFTRAINDTFALGAVTAISSLPLDIQKAITYDTIGERAVAFMRLEGAKMVVDISDASRAGIRAAVERSLSLYTNPTKQSYVIRQLIGLTDPQANAVLNFREQLETRSNLGLTPAEDRRLSAVEQSMVSRHMRDGYLTDAQINQLVERYYQSMLNKRALDIARTEALNAVNNGHQELWEQGLDQGVFNDEEDRKFWIVTRDDRLRPTHAAIPGLNPNGVKIRSLFVTPFGLVRGPGDRNVNLINCRCVVVLGWHGQQYTRDGYIQ